MACDIVVAAKSAKFIQSFSAIGLIPDSGGTWILPRLIGQARALGLALTGEPLPAERAAEWGMIWKPFLTDESPTLLVLSNPPVYRFTNQADPDIITRRALTLPPEQTSALAEALGDKFIVKNNPAPRVALKLTSHRLYAKTGTVLLEYAVQPGRGPKRRG